MKAAARILAGLAALWLASVQAAEPKVYKDRIEPHWFNENKSFWYRNELPGGTREFVRVDAESGSRRAAFDHARAAEAFEKLTGTKFEAGKLPVEAVQFEDGQKALLLLGLTNQWRLNLDNYEMAAVGGLEGASHWRSLPNEGRPRASRRAGPETVIFFINRLDRAVDLFWINDEGERQPYGSLEPDGEKRQHTFSGHVWLAALRNGAAAGVFAAADTPARAVIEERRSRAEEPEAPSTTAPSPDGRWEAFARDHNLWLRERSSKQEFALTFDGNPGNSFRKDASRDRMIGMDYEKEDYPASLPEVFWSPDSRKLAALQTRSVPERRVQLIESSPKDQLQPKLHSYPYLKPGDEIPAQTPRLFHVETRREIPVSGALFANAWDLSGFRWAKDSSRFTFVFNERGHQLLRVIAVDAATGAARAIVEERSATFIDYSGKFFLDWIGDGELLWMSERGGWNHLYLYDADVGAVKNQITRGEWAVRRVLRVDAEKREVWFMAAGAAAGQDPYHFHLCRAKLDGSGFHRLTEGDGTHDIQWQPGNRYFIDTWSRVDAPPVIELRRAEDGALACRLEEADASEILAARGRFPERFSAQGRDGATEIFGIIHRPKNFEVGRKYPVLENIYAGPHDFHVPKSFRARYRHQEELADAGFIVVQIDGMGTSWRSKAFHDVAAKNLRDAGFPDRIAWLKAAAAKFLEFDLSRLGIYGGSAGGQNALAALLWHGDFYKAAAADCGCHDNRMDKIWWNEQWMGWPIGPHYTENSNVVNAHRLQGDLLLVVGELDRNVDPASTLQVANALAKAGKKFELLLMPGAGHGAAETPYASKRRLDFFVQHLQAQP